MSGDVTFVLGASGHIAGVINPPEKKKRSHWVTGSGVRRLPASAQDWLASAQEQPGSWWPVWADWLKGHGGKLVNAKMAIGEHGFIALVADTHECVEAAGRIIDFCKTL